MAQNSNSGWDTNSGATNPSTAGFGNGTTGTKAPASTGSSSFGVSSASDRGTDTGSDTCAHCGQSLNRAGLEQFLGRLGINDEMINNLKTQFQNVDVDEYLNTARDYLKDSSGKAQTYAKENPGKVAAGVAALALGAGLIFAATREK